MTAPLGSPPAGVEQAHLRQSVGGGRPYRAAIGVELALKSQRAIWKNGLARRQPARHRSAE